MKRYWSMAAGLLVFFLLTFLLVETLNLSILSDPSDWLRRGGLIAAAVGVGLLVIDVLLPVPSSLVMVAHGAFFGTIAGTLLSLIGSTGATLTGYFIGRRGGPLLGRLITDEERMRADAMIERWGAIAIVATRPLPMIAETTAILAGASKLSLRSVSLAAVIGSLPPSLLYAVAGSIAATFQSAALMFIAVVLVTSAFWLVNRRLIKNGRTT